MSDIIEQLDTAFKAVACCHCGNGIADGCCDNHDPSWNPCPDSQLIHDARQSITTLRTQLAEAEKQESALRHEASVLMDIIAARDATIEGLMEAIKTAIEKMHTPVTAKGMDYDHAADCPEASKRLFYAAETTLRTLRTAVDESGAMGGAASNPLG